MFPAEAASDFFAYSRITSYFAGIPISSYFSFLQISLMIRS